MFFIDDIPDYSYDMQRLIGGFDKDHKTTTTHDPYMEIHRSDILLFACERIICSPKNCATSEP